MPLTCLVQVWQLYMTRYMTLPESTLLWFLLKTQTHTRDQLYLRPIESIRLVFRFFISRTVSGWLAALYQAICPKRFSQNSFGYGPVKSRVRGFSSLISFWRTELNTFSSRSPLRPSECCKELPKWIWCNEKHTRGLMTLSPYHLDEFIDCTLSRGIIKPRTRNYFCKRYCMTKSQLITTASEFCDLFAGPTLDG